MSYGRGYNTADADIFSSIARNSPQGSKSISFATKEDDDPYGTKKSPYSKTAGNFGQTGASRRKDDTKKYGDDVDDLLNMIEGKSDLTSTQKKPPLARSPTRTNQEIGSNKFLDEFMEDDVASSVYVPLGRQDRAKSQPGGYDDINKKKSALFGLSDPALSLKTTPSQDNTINTGTRSRPLTSDPKPHITTTGPGDSEIGEINLTVSRRAGRGKQPAATKDNTRPFTSAGIIERPESQFSDDRSLGAETPGLARRQHRNLMEEEDDGDSDYLSGIMNRDRADSKKSLGQGFGSSAYGTEVGGRRHLGVDNQTVPGDGTPRKSDFGHSRDQFYPHSQNTLDDPPANRRDFTFPRTQTAGNIKRDYYDTASQLMSHTSQAGSITNIGGGRRNRAGETAVNRSEGGVNRMEDDIANLVRMQQQNTGPVGSHGGQGVSQNAIGTPMRDASILIQEGLDPTRGGYAMHDTAGKEYLKETEEFYKKRMKEAEEYYEKRFEDLKRAMEDEKKKWEASYTKEIELLKKEKEDLKESVKVQVERERDRMKEIFNLELESKEKTHKYELEKQRHLLEEQNEGLKRQLEAQTRLNSLADEVRASSNKLISLTDRLEQEKGKDGTGKKNELFDRERRIEENEIRMKHEQATWESEKKRLEKLRNDIENRESEVQKTLERERELLRKEYQRLTELQNSIKDQEVESKRKVESERKAWEQEKNRLEKENNQIKEDYREKYHQFELKAELFETQKVEFQSMIDQSEMALREKHEEADNIRKRLAVQEAEMLRRTKLLEHKEMISRKETDEVQSKLSMLEMERLAIEKEKLEMRDVAGKAREDADAMSRFRREYEIEKEKNMQLRLEMDALTRTLHNEREKLTEEKNSLGMLHKTLEGIRYNYVKGMTIPEPTSFLGTGKPSELASFGKENKNDPFGFRKVGTMLNFTEGLAQNRTSPVKTGARPSSVAEKYRQTHDNTMSRPAPVFSKENYSDNVPVSKGRSTVGLGKEAGGEKMTTAKPFNYKMFMDQLKQYDSTSSNNQMYIANEKEGLMKNKIDFAGSGSLARLKSLGNTDSSLRSSPKFKNSIPLNRYDKVEDL